MIKCDLLVSKATNLGEGPVWDGARNRVIWTDYIRQDIHFYDMKSGTDRVEHYETGLSSAYLKKDGGLYFAGRGGLFETDDDGKNIKFVSNPEKLLGDYFNDGKCDRHGRIWCGTIDRSPAHAGGLYRIDGTGYHVMETGITISNGLCWSPDDTVMYYIDTPTLSIYAYDYDGKEGTVANRRVIVNTDIGMPDGMTIDKNGNLWVAHWAGNCVSCYDPANGKVLERIELPARHVTCCSFGGDDMGTMFITTAYDSKSADPEKDMGGSLYATRIPGVFGEDTCKVTF